MLKHARVNRSRHEATKKKRHRKKLLKNKNMEKKLVIRVDWIECILCFKSSNYIRSTQFLPDSLFFLLLNYSRTFNYTVIGLSIEIGWCWKEVSWVFGEIPDAYEFDIWLSSIMRLLIQNNAIDQNWKKKKYGLRFEVSKHIVSCSYFSLSIFSLRARLLHAQPNAPKYVE